jgi:hypothetical protein
MHRSRLNAVSEGTPAMQTPNPSSPLSLLFCDPFVRAAFERAERKPDNDQTLRVTNDRPLTRDGGAAERLFEAHNDQLALA